VFCKDMGVVNEMSGRPTMVLTGGAKAQLDRLVPAGMTAKVHLTITDDHPYAQAVVIIEAN
jgi:holo-[acyl-carrier protein] synthase